MANVFKPKRSSTASSVPTTANLEDGELAVNSADQKIYLRDGASIVEVGNAAGGISNVVEDTTPQLGGTLDTNGNLIQFGDSSGATDDRLQFGASQDLEIYHDGSNSIINDNGTGELKIQRGGFDRLTLTSGGVDVNLNLKVKDDYALQVGTDNDLQIYETASDVAMAYAGTGVLFMRTGGDWKVDKNGSNRIYAHSAGAVDLYYSGSKKLETTNTGITVTGSIVKSGGTSSQYLMADGSVTTGSSGIEIENNGTSVGTGITAINFSTNVTATVSGGIATVTASGGGSVGVSSGGTEITSDTSSLNFVGTGLTITDDGTTTNIYFPTTTRTTTSFTATTDQTTFSGLDYNVGYVDVYLNGSKLDSAEYTASNGTSVVLTTGASVDDIIEIVAYTNLSIVGLSGLQDIVDDTSPQLGGNLDLNSKDVSGTSNFNVTGIITATTFSGTNINGGTYSGNVDLSGLLKEGVNITAGKLSANTNIDLANGMVHLFTTTETATSTPNIRYDASNSLDSKMDTGESITVVLISAAAAAGYSAELTIDGSAVTEEWLGGSAPSTGGSGGYDVYTYNIIKTGSATFIVLANLVNFA